MIPEEQIDLLIEDLDDSGGAMGSYWEMLKHAERHGFDLAALKPAIQSFLASGRSGLDAPLSEADEHALMLALRCRMRAQMQLPPLSAAERADWRWEDHGPTRRYRYTGPPTLNNQPRMTPDQVAAIVSFMQLNHPEAVRYLRSVRAHNAGMSKNGGIDDHWIVRQAWHFRFMMDATCAVIGESGDVNLELWLIEEAVVG